MIKNLFLLFLILLLVFTSLIIQEFLNHKQNIATFKAYTSPSFKISDQLLKNYYSNDTALQDEASKSIVLTTLNNLNFQQWIDYIDYIDILLYQSNISSEENNELIVVLNLSKDLAVIAIYTSLNDEYVFISSIENLLPIQSITFLPIPASSYNFIVTNQLLDERLGGFFIEEFIEIFLYQNNVFKSVWKKTKYMDEIYNAQWINPSESPSKWIEVIERNTIEFHKKPRLSISVSTHKQKLQAIKDTFPLKEDFHPLKALVVNECFYWSPKYQNFIMNEGIVQNTTKSVAILDDTENWLEYYLGFKSRNYKVLTEDQKIFYIKKQDITITP
ncbi:hypothetical protein QBE52_07855 [Clostridiaceae bacterium 35-E11]